MGSLEEVCYERQCSKEGLAGEIVDGDGGDSLRFSEAELKSLFEPKFASLSNFHDRSKCTCCAAPPLVDAPKTDESASKPTDPRGYRHLLPESSELASADPCLWLAASVSPVSLCYCKVTDMTSDDAAEDVARGFPSP